MKHTIHFAHANGFPSSCYRKMFSYILDEFDLNYIDTIGHQTHYPVTDNWDYLTKELIENIERSHDNPVIGVGHSLGGVLNYLAASQRPDLFKAIVMLDSPVYGYFKSSMIRLFKQLKLIDYITPGKRTKNRRNVWQNKQELYQYLKTKALFKYFDEDCLNDYIEYGMQHNDDAVYLKFDSDIEYAIYRTIPHHLAKINKRVTVPKGLVYGEYASVLKPSDVNFMQNSLHFRVMSSKGSHLFPFEYPEAAANALKRVIGQLVKF